MIQVLVEEKTMSGLRLFGIVLFSALLLAAGCSSDSPGTGGGGTDELPDLEFTALSAGFATTVEQGQYIAVRRSFRDANGSGGGDDMLAAPLMLADIEPFEISYYLSADATFEPGTDVLMPPAEEITWMISGYETPLSYFSVTIPSGMPAGSYSVFGMIDSGEDIDETDESNNTGAFSPGQYIVVIETGSGLPDLYVATSRYQSVVTQGQQATADVEVVNVGVVYSGTGCTGRLYMSDDNQYDAGDYLLVASGSTIKPLAVGEGQRFYFTYIVPDTYSGEVNLLFVVDADHEIVESDENDNVCQMMLTVNVP